MSRWAQQERDAFCDTLTRVGPDRPTLCEGWQTRDLVAHLLVRERRLDAAAAVALPFLAGHRDRVQAAAAHGNWDRMIATLRSGPPRWTPLALPPVDEAANLAEFFVHHEDVRRAGGEFQRRELHPAMEQELWRSLKRVRRLVTRRAPVGIRAEGGPGRSAVLRDAPAGHGDVVIAGKPSELTLYLFGRMQVADVDIRGAEEDRAALGSASFGV